VIRGAIVHLLNEQPVVVDLLEMPTQADTGLLCTNIRTLDGKKPIFIDASDSTFFFPYLNVRFVEMHSDVAGTAEGAASTTAAAAATVAGEDDDLEIDEDFLRRVREA
jgi:hypothetical protein